MCNYFRPALLVRVGRRLDLASLEFGRKSRYHRSKPGQLHVYSKLIFFFFIVEGAISRCSTKRSIHLSPPFRPTCRTTPTATPRPSPHSTLHTGFHSLPHQIQQPVQHPLRHQRPSSPHIAKKHNTYTYSTPYTYSPAQSKPNRNSPASYKPISSYTSSSQYSLFQPPHTSLIPTKDVEDGLPTLS